MTVRIPSEKIAEGVRVSLEKAEEHLAGAKVLIENKKILYLLEAETEIYTENTEVLHFGKDASNGDLLLFQRDSKAWRNIKILKDGNYTLAIQVNGSVLINIDNQTFTVNSSSLNFVYHDLYLERGIHMIEILTEKYQPITWTFNKSKSDYEEWKNLF